MTKRFSSKVLAVVLTLAICATTVLGCLMTVSAAESCYSFGAPKFPSKDDLSQVSLDVTFTAPAVLPNGLSAGSFEVKEVDADAADYLTLKEVNSETSGVSAGLEGDKVIFETDVTNMVTLELVFGFSNGVGTQGRDYYVTLEDVELAFNDVEYYNETADGPVAKISTACEHVVTVIGDPIAIDEANNYSTYAKSVCTICGEEFGKQLVPTAEKLVDDGANGTATGKVVYWDNTKTAPTSTAAGTADDPIIINTPAELAYIATATNSKETVNPDKYYKIADDIKAFVLQSETYGAEIMALSGSDAVRDYFSDTSKSFYQWKGVSDKTNIFSGHFDGNGITVYGLYNTETNRRQGLFGEVDGNATICNVNVKGAYITTTSGWEDQGAIVGSNRNKYGVGPGTGGQDTLVIKKCSVIDCYMRSSDTVNDNRSANGVIAGRSPTGVIMIDNCFISGNDTLFTNNTLSQEYALYGNALNSWNVDSNSAYFKGAYDYYYPTLVENGSCVCNMVVNTVAIGTLPYHLGYYGNRLDNKECFINVYTDGPAGKVANSYVASGTTYNVTVDYAENQIANVATANLKGSAAVIAMPNLDWDKTWLIGENDGYPYLAPQGYTSDTIYWNGTTSAITSTAAGTAEDPIIINTAEELAWLVKDATADVSKGASNVTTDKYYKIADGIKNIVLQPYAYAVQIKKLNGSAETKAYFDANSASMLKWVNEGWEQGSFAGIFDGNNATIYGMYQETTSNAGLFTTVDAGAVFKNFAVKNSYLIVNKAVDSKKPSGYTDYQLSVIAATSSSNSYGAQRAGIILVENCEVSGNYLRQNTSIESGWDSRTGVLVGNVQQDVLAVENCLVYDNNATYGREADESVKAPLIANAGNNDIVESSATIPAGYEKTTHTEYNNDGTVKAVKVCATVRDSIILGCDVMNVALDRAWRRNGPGLSYKNVYTDGVSGTVTFPSGAQWTYAEDEIAAITYADALGTRAQSKLPNLAWGTDWFCGANNQPPVLAPFASIKSGTNNVSSSDLQLVGSSVNYNDNGTLNFNLHFVPNKAGVNALLYVGTSDASKFYKLEATKSTYSNELGENALMFTIPNLSARDIDKIWLPTVVTTGNFVEWGLTQPIALVDNAEAVLAGNYDDADKQVAAALINYNVAADEALSITTNSSIEKTKVVYAPNNSFDGSIIDGTHGTGTEKDPYIISTYGHWRFVAEKATYEETYGKFFKVDPTIKMFVFQQENFIKKVGGLDAFLALDAQGVKEVFENGDAYGRFIMRHNNSGTFAGTLDGSGVQIVGMSGVYYNASNVMQKGTGGLFGKIHEDATIKNLTISHTYNNTGDLNGLLIGYVANHSAASDNVRKITIENVVLRDNYQITTANGLSRSGILIGRVDPGYIAIHLDGIISYDNLALGQRSKDTSVEGYSDMLPCALVGWYSSAWNGGTANPNGSYKNIISLGSAPYPVGEQANQGTKPEYWSNVYTDTVASFTPCTQTNYPNVYNAKEWSSYDITILTPEQVSNLKGANAMTICSKLDWNTGWVFTDGYPQPIQSGYTSGGKTIYWNGTLATGFESGSGTKDDPFVIATAEQLAYFVKDYTKPKNDSFTAGSYYKIADGIDKIVLQDAAYADDIIALENAAAVKAYFEANVSNMHAWVNEGWEQGSFYGNFDGNGVEVYGLYSNTNVNAGLFNTLDAGAVIKNISVVNSYMKSNRIWNEKNSRYDSYQVGAIAPVVSNSGSYGAGKAGIIWLDNCKAINNYMTHDTEDKNRCGVLVGSVNNDTLYVTNCLTYGNDAAYNNGIKMPLIGDFANGLKFENATAPEGLTLVARSDNSAYVANGIHNTISLGCVPYNDAYFTTTSGGRNTVEVFKNAYTDVATSNAYITVISDVNSLKGDKATSIVNALNAANGKTVWYVGATGEYPSLEPATAIPGKYQAKLDAVKFTTPDVVGNGTVYNSANNMVFGVYQTALSLKANPYISFAFAFGGEYKTNRDKIKVRFTYTVDGALTTSDEIAVPAYTGEDIKNVNGWTNTTANGRFHTFKSECIPVEALANGIKVEASYNGGAWQDFGTYSVEGLGMQFDALSKTQPGDYYATRVDAAKALLFYAQAIAARYGA